MLMVAVQNAWSPLTQEAVGERGRVIGVELGGDPPVVEPPEEPANTGEWGVASVMIIRTYNKSFHSNCFCLTKYFIKCNII